MFLSAESPTIKPIVGQPASIKRSSLLFDFQSRSNGNVMRQTATPKTANLIVFHVALQTNGALPVADCPSRNVSSWQSFHSSSMQPSTRSTSCNGAGVRFSLQGSSKTSRTELVREIAAVVIESARRGERRPEVLLRHAFPSIHAWEGPCSNNPKFGRVANFRVGVGLAVNDDVQDWFR